ncbi:non-membrane spanning protein tyrosine kinase [Branchiostoma belcheri]|nr:non-membrane spanning protein tyrosine kinase [Branchiostoma belcheri]
MSQKCSGVNRCPDRQTGGQVCRWEGVERVTEYPTGAIGYYSMELRLVTSVEFTWQGAGSQVRSEVGWCCVCQEERTPVLLFGEVCSRVPPRTTVTLMDLQISVENPSCTQKSHSPLGFLVPEFPVLVAEPERGAMSADESPDWLGELLAEVQLEQFLPKLRDELHVTRLSHFDYVKGEDLEKVGMGKPGQRRLMEAIKRKKAAQRKSWLGKGEDLEKVGMGKPGQRRLMEAIKRKKAAQRKSWLGKRLVRLTVCSLCGWEGLGVVGCSRRVGTTGRNRLPSWCDSVWVEATYALLKRRGHGMGILIFQTVHSPFEVHCGGLHALFRKA